MRGRNRRRRGIRVGTPLRWRPCKGAKVQKWKGGLKKGDGCQVTGIGRDKRQWEGAKVQRWKGERGLRPRVDWWTRGLVGWEGQIRVGVWTRGLVGWEEVKMSGRGEAGLFLFH